MSRSRIIALAVILAGSFAILADQAGVFSGGGIVPIIRRAPLGSLVVVESAEDRTPAVAALVRSRLVSDMRERSIVVAVLDDDDPEARSKYQEILTGSDLPVALVFDDAGKFAGSFEIGGDMSVDDIKTRIEELAAYAD